MNIKCFSERINHELASSGFPSNEQEKARAFAKVFDISPHMAALLLKGQANPSDDLIHDIAQEFEVNVDWLKGNIDHP